MKGNRVMSQKNFGENGIVLWGANDYALAPLPSSVGLSCLFRLHTFGVNTVTPFGQLTTFPLKFWPDLTETL